MYADTLFFTKKCNNKYIFGLDVEFNQKIYYYFFSPAALLEYVQDSWMMCNDAGVEIAYNFHGDARTIIGLVARENVIFVVAQ